MPLSAEVVAPIESGLIVLLGLLLDLAWENQDVGHFAVVVRGDASDDARGSPRLSSSPVAIQVIRDDQLRFPVRLVNPEMEIGRDHLCDVRSTWHERPRSSLPTCPRPDRWPQRRRTWNGSSW